MSDHKLTAEELNRRLEEATKQVVVGGEYRHYKGNMYRVQSLAILEETNEVCVVYQPLYGNLPLFIRPLSVWLETVEWRGRRVPRFAKA